MFPAVKELKEGEAGKRKLNQWTRYGTLVLAAAQSIGISIWLADNGAVTIPGFMFYFVAAVTLVTGTMPSMAW